MDRADLPATNPDGSNPCPTSPSGLFLYSPRWPLLKRVVMLSGDVHHPTSVVDELLDRPTRSRPFAQFICSALKNDFFVYRGDRQPVVGAVSARFAAGRRHHSYRLELTPQRPIGQPAGQPTCPPSLSQARPVPALVARLQEIRRPRFHYRLACWNEWAGVVNRPTGRGATDIVLDERPRAG